MKWILGLSVLLNSWLIYQLSQTKSNQGDHQVTEEYHNDKKPPLERKIIESTATAAEQPCVAATKLKKKKRSGTGGMANFSDPELDAMNEKVYTDKNEYLQGKLGLTSDQLEKIQKIKNKTYDRIQVLYAESPFQEPSIEKRRQILSLEEKLTQDIQKIMGEKKWEDFQKFRQDYNQELLKNQTDPDQPLMIMDL